ncbi:MAG: hypothetical protein DCF22_16865 [Leptolyngbya sp.]|nr:MAG: hypothetical protein DCF22_16865 [Leptolyngbya sp.]
MAISATITFSNQQTAAIAEIAPGANLPDVLGQWGLVTGRPVLVVVGGASKLSESDYRQVEQLFHDALAPIAQKYQASVVDGGTDAGVMRLMGHARQSISGTFPLVGVSPIGLSLLPDQSLASPDAASLEPHHSHFLLVPGSNWGDESAWLADVGTHLAAGAPSVTVLINGGEVTWEDARQSIRAERLIIAIAGSGRTADLIAAGLRGDPTDDRAKELIASGLVQAADLTTGAIALASTIEAIFKP